jgi:diguanylate cyclase (GGDEF)-like protein/PAS domain S-box-containing protein
MPSQSSSTKTSNISLTGEELLRTLLDTMPDIVCFKDGTGRWLEANKADLELFQLLGIDYIGKKDSELAVFSPFYQEAFLTCEASDEEAWSAEAPIQGEESIPMPGGGRKVFDVYKIPLFNADGSRKGLVVLGRDITPYKLAQEELQQLRRQENIINQLLRIGFQDSSLDAQLYEALDTIISLPWLHFAPKGGIFLVSKTQPESLTLFVHKNMDASLLKHCQEIRFGECLCGMAARDKEIVCAPTLPKEHQYRHDPAEEQSHYIVPIVHFEKILGVLMLYGEASLTCNEGLRGFMKTVASTLALLIDQQEAEDRLRLNEANLTKAQQIARMGYWEWQIAENRLLWSDEACRIFGLAPEQAPSSYDVFVAYVHSDDRQRLQDAVQHTLTTREPYNLQYRIVHKNAMLRNVHAEGEVERDANGVPVRMFGTIQDITLRKQSEKQLALAAKVFESSIEGITITDAKGLIQSVNKAFTQITGYSPEEAIGKKPNILKSDRHDQTFYQAMWSLLRDTGKWEGEIWNRRKNGEVYPEQLTITAITDEYGQLTHHVAVFHDLSDIHGYQEQIHFQAYHDALTLLPNRLLLLDRLKVAIRHAQRLTKYSAVLCLDLDNFKHVNDCLGHMAGDILLQQVAERLKGCVAADSTVARLGGDDFAILVEQCDDVKDAVLIAEKILEQFVAPFNLTSYETFITASIGITCFPTDGSDAEILLKNAELAMYRAKNEGKNKCQLFTKSMNAKVIHRLSLENSMRKAVDRNEFLVYYQPKVSASSGKIVGMEALVRWRKRDGQLISPLDFIPLAEETGLIIPIGAYVLRQACLDTGKWLKRNKNLSVSVNLSARQFMQENLVDKIAAILKETRFPAAKLELEITESVVMGNEQAAIEQLGELKGLGLHLGLDDFGTGYSSLQYLRKMPIDTLKIDRSFIKDLPDNVESSAIAIAIISLAQALNLELVVEGVENYTQLQFLRRQDGKEMQIQGYLFSPPVTAAAFSELLTRGPYDIDVA